MAFADAGDRRHDLPGRAIAALERVLLQEGGLHRMERLPLRGQPFDRDDGVPFGLRRERQAGEYAGAVQVHGAGAALSLIAALLGAVEAEMLAQRVEQGDARLERKCMGAPVDAEMRGGDGRHMRPASVGSAQCRLATLLCDNVTRGNNGTAGGSLTRRRYGHDRRDGRCDIDPMRYEITLSNPPRT